MVGYHRKSLASEVDIELLRRLRYEGLTNKQIAERVGCGVTTVYRYIGKRSDDVMNCQAQNKPSPVKDLAPITPEPVIEAPATVEEPVAVAKTIEEPAAECAAEKTSTLRIIQEVRILDIAGDLCNYHINPISGDVEFSNGVVTGILDRAALKTFRKELDEIIDLLGD